MMKPNRILARRVARTLTEEQLQLVTGGASGNAPGTGLLYNTGGPSGLGGAGSYDYQNKYTYKMNAWTQNALGVVD